jgi:hypothetical protein
MDNNFWDFLSSQTGTGLTISLAPYLNETQLKKVLANYPFLFLVISESIKIFVFPTHVLMIY